MSNKEGQKLRMTGIAPPNVATRTKRISEGPSKHGVIKFDDTKWVPKVVQ